MTAQKRAFPIADLSCSFDLIVSSMLSCRPAIPLGAWPRDPTAGKMTKMSYSDATGMTARIRRLPFDLAGAMLEIRTADASLEKIASDPSSPLQDVLSRQDAAQRRVLSVPSWDDLSEAETPREVYEAVRLAAILYSTAVIFPLPSDSGWHMRLADKIRHLLTSTECKDHGDDQLSLLAWAMAVGSIASHGCALFDWYVERLRRLLAQLEIWTWQQTEALLVQILWSGRACARGATVLRQALEGSENMLNETRSPLCPTLRRFELIRGRSSDLLIHVRKD
jgi:hypothetical protein